jgi:hypothetical protein
MTSLDRSSHHSRKIARGPSWCLCLTNAIGQELETLLHAAWLRVQNLPPFYLPFDFKFPLNAHQAVAVDGLFGNRTGQVVKELREWKEGDGDGMYLTPRAFNRLQWLSRLGVSKAVRGNPGPSGGVVLHLGEEVL